jgi:hypothetical protein
MNRFHIGKTRKTTKREATVSLFTPVLAPLFPTVPSAHSARSSGLSLTFRAGTDPQLGGHRAAPGDRNPHGRGQGGAS